jgi:hypothetical protein
LASEHWQVALHDLPYLAQIDPEIIVNNNVSHPGDLRPRNLWVKRSKLARELACGLADDLDIVNNPGLDQFVF